MDELKQAAIDWYKKDMAFREWLRNNHISDCKTKDEEDLFIKNKLSFATIPLILAETRLREAIEKIIT